MANAQQRQFVVVHNRNRDFYQVALALHENRQLESLVTDAYLRQTGRLVDRLFPGRFAAGLPPGRVQGNWRAVLAQVPWELARRVGLSIPFPTRHVNRVLGRQAGRLAFANDAGLVAYSGAGIHAFGDGVDPRVLFVFHPHPTLVREILQEDASRFPFLSQTMKLEPEVRNHDRLVREADEELKRATTVLVASRFSRRSIEFSRGDGADRRGSIRMSKSRCRGPVPTPTLNEPSRVSLLGSGGPEERSTPPDPCLAGGSTESGQIDPRADHTGSCNSGSCEVEFHPRVGETEAPRAC